MKEARHKDDALHEAVYMKSYKRQNHGDGEQAPTVGPRENRSLTVGPGRRIGLQKWPGTLCGMVACCVSHLSLVAP